MLHLPQRMTYGVVACKDPLELPDEGASKLPSITIFGHSAPERLKRRHVERKRPFRREGLALAA
jgi:hypothetical protein